MAENKDVKIVNSRLNKDGTGTLTVQMTEAGLQKMLQRPELAMGSWMPQNSGTGLGSRYGLRDSQQLKIPTDRLQMIKLSRDLYKYEPVVANVIDLLVDLSLTGMQNEGADEEAEEFFDEYCRLADFDSLHRDIFLEYYLSGDVFIMRGRQHMDEDDDNQFWHDYTVLNPEFVEVRGTMLLNTEVIAIKVPDDLVKLLNGDSTAEKRLAKQVPLKIRKAAGEGFYVPDQDTVSRISRKRQPYERYATPYLTRVFEPVLLKRRMREADTALAETVRTVLVTITIGNDTYPATPADLEKAEEVIRNPSKSQELIWNHTLQVEYHYPDADLFSQDKYNQVNADIIQGLGIPPVLIDGGGGTFATAWTSLLAVVERLEVVRRQVIRWQENEYRKIAEIAGIEDEKIPSVRFSPLNLRDDKVFANILTSLWDRGLISAETMMISAGLDFDAEIRRITAEQETLDEVIVPKGKAGPSAGPGRPSDTLDEGNYTDRDKTPAPKGGEETTNEQANRPR